MGIFDQLALCIKNGPFTSTDGAGTCSPTKPGKYRRGGIPGGSTEITEGEEHPGDGGRRFKNSALGMDVETRPVEVLFGEYGGGPGCFSIHLPSGRGGGSLE